MLFAIALVLAIPHTGALIDEAIDVIKLSKEISEQVLVSWEIASKPFNLSKGVDLPIYKHRERLVLAKLAQVYTAIGRVEMQVDRLGAVVNLLAQRSHKGTALELKLDETAKQLERIHAQDGRMREYVENQELLERSTLEEFAAWCVSPGGESLSWVLERLHGLVMPGHKHLLGRGLFSLMIEELQSGHPELCELQMSPHQIVFDTYNAIALAEIKGYAMMQFSYMLLRIYGKGNYTQEANLYRKRYGDRAGRTAAAARAALAAAPRDMYRCDPPHHVEGETYEEVTKLLQGIIENEVNLNKDSTCKENCAYYSVSKSYGCRDKHCDQLKKCNGRVINCQYIDSDMWTCPAGRNSHRRYNWIEYENGQVLGKYGTCSQGVTKVDSWWRWLFWHCSYCMCICDDPAYDSHRYFSLWDTTSDVNNNKVVTGVRLAKLDRIFHLQISEGTLGERGNVTPGAWVPVAKFDPTDQGTVEGQDYHTLTYERRAIDLDVLDSPVGHALTGVRFRMLGAHLHFEIRSTPFNYTTGKLQPEKSQWISNDNTDGAENLPRVKYNMSSPDVPTRMHSPHMLDSEHDQYLEFTHTDLYADAAQTTVPFIDIQDVQPLQGAALLSGAGVAHRGLTGSGGFLTLKVITYDQGRHLTADPPPSPIRDVESMDFAPVIN